MDYSIGKGIVDKRRPVATGERLLSFVARKSLSGNQTVLWLCTGLLAGLLLAMSLSTKLSCWWNWCPAIATTGRVDNYFSNFRGFDECQIRAAELYTTAEEDRRRLHSPDIFCRDRGALLQALSEGGRIGFDAPYTPRGCHYQWFSPLQICFILERFENVVFIGDQFLHAVYAGFNILLRQDLLHGALDLTSMPSELQTQCRCGNQFTKQQCRGHYIKDSSASGTSQENQAGQHSLCPHTRHAFLAIDSANPSPDTIARFQRLVPKAPRSHYHPIPIIHSLSPSTLPTAAAAKTSLLKFLELADFSNRKTPMLWLGPTAAGHLDIKGRKGNQEIWDFDRAMSDAARENDVERLGMWNLTVQTNSVDGVRVGEKVAIVQAMMVVNWLARLEGS